VQRRIDLDKLKLVAPRDGTVLPPPIVEKRGDETAHLPAWNGSPFDPENIGARLVTQTKFCQIGDPKLMEARLVIEQNDIEFVAPGQKVEIMLDQTADYVYTNCEIERVSTEDLKTSPSHISSLHGGPLASKMDPSGVARPMNPIFEAVVPLPEKDPNNLLRLGLIGKAKITTAPRTLFSRLYRYAAHTFNFEL
jgi:putative peptide zinc metalloprotease protein